MGIQRFAFDAIRNTGKFLLNNAGRGPGEIAMRLVPDVGFGVLAAVQTPGDMGDKLIAGTTSAVGGSLGGITTAGALRGMRILLWPRSSAIVGSLNVYGQAR